MANLADLLNAPTEIEFEGKKYLLRQPTLLECAQYTRGLEQDARAGAARAVELPEQDRRNLLRDVQADIAAGVYAWGGEVCVKSLGTPHGVAKLMAIICREQGMTEAIAHKIVAKQLEEMAAIIVGELEADPSGKALGRLLSRAGQPPNLFTTSSSDSPTPPTGGRPTSPPSPG